MFVRLNRLLQKGRERFERKKKTTKKMNVVLGPVRVICTKLNKFITKIRLVNIA